MRYSIVLFILFFSLPVEAHPLHLSVTNISIENGSLKISIKTFRDDWETAYFHYQSRTIDLKKPANIKSEWITAYLENVFRISQAEESSSLEIELDTIMVEEDNMTIEMRCKLPDEMNSLYLYNTLLIDIFMDQTNLVIIGLKDKEIGIKFDYRKRGEVISLR